MQDFFEENEIEQDSEDTIIRRELTATGKSRAFINDTPVGLSQLKELGEQLVDVHSQHQNLLLQKQDFQLNVVDIIANDSRELTAYQQTYSQLQTAQSQLQTMKDDIERNRQSQDFLQFQCEELENARRTEGTPRTLRRPCTRPTMPYMANRWVQSVRCTQPRTP